MPKLIRQLPQSEQIMTTYTDGKSNRFFLTAHVPARDFYVLYRLSDDGLARLGRASNPLELEEKFGVIKELWGGSDE